jgi:hypothetical protein
MAQPIATEYPLTSFPSSGEEGLFHSADGNAWVVGAGINDGMIARITATTGAVSGFSLGSAGSWRGFAESPIGTLWFASSSLHEIASIGTDGTGLSTVSTPGDPLGIVKASDGNLWVAACNGPSAFFLLYGDGFVSYPAQFGFCGPGYFNRLLATSDGYIWFTNASSGAVGRFSVTTHSSNFVAACSDPDWLTAGSDNGIWYTCHVDNKIGRIDRTTLVVTEYPVPDGYSFPDGIATSSDGALWVAFYDSPPGIARFSGTQPLTQLGTDVVRSSCGGKTAKLSVSPVDGRMWFTDQGCSFLDKAGVFCPNVLATAAASAASVCLGQSITLTASGGSSCQWTTGSGIANPSSCSTTATPTGQGGIYTVVVTGANGCQAQAQVTVEVFGPPSIPDVSLPSSAKVGDTGLIATINSPDQFSSYTWTITNGTIDSGQGTTRIVFHTQGAGQLTLAVFATNAAGCRSATASKTLTVTGSCAKPNAPAGGSIGAAYNPGKPVGGTDFLLVQWTAPAPGTPLDSYSYHINGDIPKSVAPSVTSAIAPPRNNTNDVTLYVRAVAAGCVTTLSDETPSATVSLKAPAASFSVPPPPVRANTGVTFTNTSSPAPLESLWFFPDGTTDQAQSPTHTFSTPGRYMVVLLASNGSGTSETSQIVEVSASGSAVTASPEARLVLGGPNPERRRLEGITVVGPGQDWLHVVSLEEQTAIFAYLRFLDEDGELILERRIIVRPGEHAINDIGAFGLAGTYTIELVSSRKFAAWLSVPAAHVPQVPRGPVRPLQRRQPIHD